MPASPAPSASRVTPERIAALVQRYATLQGLAASGWTFTVEIVAGLQHLDEDGQLVEAWAVVDPDPVAKTAQVRVRDIDATPIPGFDGDAMLEIRVTVAHELLHCVVAEAMGGATTLTIDAEEHIVEAAAQAMVRSEGLDARVMARAVRAALPSALRARVAARAPQGRARGGSAMAMNPDTVAKLVEAIQKNDAAAMMEIGKQLLIEAASGADAGAPEPEPGGDEAPPVEAAKVAGPPAPGGAAGGAVVPPARAKEGDPMGGDKEVARARKALLDGAAEVTAALAIIRPAAKTQVVVGVRARLGSALTPALEADIMAAPDLAAAQTLAAFAEKHLGGGAQRARSGVEHEQNAGPATTTPPTVDVLRADGFTEPWLIGYANALRSGPEVASAFLEQGRASPRARIAKPTGGAS